MREKGGEEGNRERMLDIFSICTISDKWRAGREEVKVSWFCLELSANL